MKEELQVFLASEENLVWMALLDCLDPMDLQAVKEKRDFQESTESVEGKGKLEFRDREDLRETRTQERRVSTVSRANAAEMDYLVFLETEALKDQCSKG